MSFNSMASDEQQTVQCPATEHTVSLCIMDGKFPVHVECTNAFVQISFETKLAENSFLIPIDKNACFGEGYIYFVTLMVYKSVNYILFLFSSLFH